MKSLPSLVCAVSLAGMTLQAAGPPQWHAAGPGAASVPELLVFSGDEAPGVNPPRRHVLLSWPLCSSRGKLVFNSGIPAAGGGMALFAFDGEARRIVEDRQTYWARPEGGPASLPTAIHFEADAVDRINAVPVGVINDSGAVLFRYPLRPRGGYASSWPQGVPSSPALWQTAGSEPAILAARGAHPDDFEFFRPPGPPGNPEMFLHHEGFLDIRFNNGGFFVFRARNAVNVPWGADPMSSVAVYGGTDRNSLELLAWDDGREVPGIAELARDANSGFFTTHPKTDGNASINTLFRFDGGGATRVLGPGDPLPGLAQSFDRLFLWDVDVSGPALIEVRTGGISHGLWEVSADGTHQREVVRFNTEISTPAGPLTLTRLAGLSPGAFNVFNPRQRGGRTAFVASYDGLNDSNGLGLFTVNPDGSVRIVFLANRAVEGADFVFQIPTASVGPALLAMSPNGTIAFTMPFSGGPVRDTRMGLFILGGDGTPRLVFHVTQPVDVREFQKTVAETAFDQRTALDDNGALHFRVRFTDGHSAIYRVTGGGTTTPQGDEFHWAGGIETDHWHTISDGRSRWKDASGRPWEVPPTAGARVFIREADGEVLLKEPSADLSHLEATRRLVVRADLKSDAARLRNVALEKGTLDVRDVVFDGISLWSGGTIQGGPEAPAVNRDAFVIHGSDPSNPPALRGKTFLNEDTVGHFETVLDVAWDARIHNRGTWNLHGDGAGFDNTRRPLGEPVFLNTGEFNRRPETASTPTNHIRIPFDNEASGRVTADGAVLSFERGGRVHGTYTVAGGGRIIFAAGGPGTPESFEVDQTVRFSGAGSVELKGEAHAGFFHIKSGAIVTANLKDTLDGFHFGGAAPVQMDGTFHNLGSATWSSPSILGRGTFVNSGGLRIQTPMHSTARLVIQPGGVVLQASKLSMDNGVENHGVWEIVDADMDQAAPSSNALLLNKGLMQLNRGRARVSLPMLLEKDGILETLVGGPTNDFIAFYGGGRLAGGTLRAGGSSIAFVKPPEAGEGYAITGEVEIDNGAGEVHFFREPIQFAGGRLKNGGRLRLEFNEFAATEAGGEILNLSELTLDTPWISDHVTIRNLGRTRMMERNDFLIRIGEGSQLINEGAVLHSGNLEFWGAGRIVNSGEYVLHDVEITAPGTRGRFENRPEGLLVAEASHRQRITSNVVLNNEGTVLVRERAHLIALNCEQIVGGMLTGGRWIIERDSRLSLGGPVVLLGAGAQVSLNGNGWGEFTPSELAAGSNLKIAGVEMNLPRLLNHGTLEIGPEGGLGAEAGFENGLESILDEIDQVIVPARTDHPPGSGPAPMAGLPPRGTRIRHGQPAPVRPMITTPVLRNGGLIRPGGPGQAGPFNLAGNLMQTAQGRIQIELGGPVPLSQHDQIRIFEGTVHLAGVLEVQLLHGFKPGPGQQFEFLIVSGSGQGVSGAFDSIAAPEGFRWSVAYLEDRAVLTVESPVERRVALRQDGGELEIHWDAGVLETSTAVTGPWIPAPDATSPYRLVPGEDQRYFRTREPVPGPGSVLTGRE
ncbi:MAG: hypothetical protein KF791_18720 [Verrucomicrobiae bacterium]|nr:hypothetical protein [Verrucomicrobiae bacterium]